MDDDENKQYVFFYEITSHTCEVIRRNRRHDIIRDIKTNDKK